MTKRGDLYSYPSGRRLKVTCARGCVGELEVVRFREWDPVKDRWGKPRTIPSHKWEEKVKALKLIARG